MSIFSVITASLEGLESTQSNRHVRLLYLRNVRRKVSFNLTCHQQNRPSCGMASNFYAHLWDRHKCGNWPTVIVAPILVVRPTNILFKICLATANATLHIKTSQNIETEPACVLIRFPVHVFYLESKAEHFQRKSYCVKKKKKKKKTQIFGNDINIQHLRYPDSSM